MIDLTYLVINHPLPDFIYQGLKDYSKNANAYRPQPKILIDKLAKKHNLPPEMIFLTAGVDEGLQMFILAFGRKSCIFTPAFCVYKDVEEYGNQLTQIFSLKNNEYVIETDNKKEITLFIFANPNNPFGSTSQEKILELVKNNPQAIIVVDEVYGDFTDLSVINDVNKYPNLVVLRSFSKSYAMAGNRIGYIIASPEIINKVKNKTQWANVSYLSVGAAVCALDHEEYFIKLRKDLIKRKDDFVIFLKKNQFLILPSLINAVLIKFSTEKEGIRFNEFLYKNGFLVNNGNGSSNIGLDKSFIRISIGNTKEMELLKKTIKRYQQKIKNE